MFAVQAPHRLWTRDEYYKMAATGLFDRNERVELIAGEIITITPQDSRHATAVRLAEDAFRPAFGQGYDVRAQLPLDLSLHSQPEPDIAVVVGNPRDYRDAHPTTALLVVEVSGASLAYDRREKASLYAQADIADYWIVNLQDNLIEVYRQPSALSGQPFGYGYRTLARYLIPDTVTPLAAPRTTVAVADLLP